MKKWVLGSATLILGSLVMLVLTVHLRMQSQTQQRGVDQALWTVGQLSLVVERVFAVTAASVATGDPGIRMEAVGTLDQALHRLEMSPQVLGKHHQEAVLGLLWLKALSQNPLKTANLTTAEELKAYRDLVVENQQKLESIRKDLKAEQTLAEASLAKYEGWLIGVCLGQVVFQILGLLVVVRRRPALLGEALIKDSATDVPAA